MTRPEALRLVQWLERDGANCQQHVDAASELRRLYEENQRCKQVCAATAEGWRVERDSLLEALKNIERSAYDSMTATLARAAIAKAEEVK